MRMGLALIAIATAASADQCQDLWFTRNLVMDRAGYCFGSPLGKAQFDNTDCLAKEVVLPQNLQSFVAEIQRRERQRSCSVNTSQTDLDVPDAHLRRTLETLPIADDFESACIGWQAAPEPLFSGASSASPVTGYVKAGDNIFFGHLAIGDWEYAIVSGPDWVPKAAGWRRGVIPAGQCAEWAG